MPVSAAGRLAPGELIANSAGSGEPLPEASVPSVPSVPSAPAVTPRTPVEIGGAPGPEPTRFGDWEKRGRCIDF